MKNINTYNKIISKLTKPYKMDTYVNLSQYFIVKQNHNV